jgi:hypothetical protein
MLRAPAARPQFSPLRGERNGVPNAWGCRVLGWEREAVAVGKHSKIETSAVGAAYSDSIADRLLVRLVLGYNPGIIQAQIKPPDQFSDQSRTVIIADQFLNIHRSKNHLIPIDRSQTRRSCSIFHACSVTTRETQHVNLCYFSHVPVPCFPPPQP